MLTPRHADSKHSSDSCLQHRCKIRFLNQFSAPRAKIAQEKKTCSGNLSIPWHDCDLPWFLLVPGHKIPWTMTVLSTTHLVPNCSTFRARSARAEPALCLRRAWPFKQLLTIAPRLSLSSQNSWSKRLCTNLSTISGTISGKDPEHNSW